VKTRVISALVGMPLVLAALFLSGPLFFWGLVLVLFLLALHEYLRLCGVERGLAAATLLAGAILLAAVYRGAVPAAAAAVLPLLVLVSLWRVGDVAVRFQSLGASVLGLAYIGYAMGCLYLLRLVPDGPHWIFLVLAATWAGDSAAFFAGSRFGRRRLAPTLSPKKTWAGAVGGLLGSVAGGLVISPSFPGGVSLPLVALFCAAVGLAGQVGDLFESLWKRAKGIKDSGTLIPGHGGILDRIDSLLLGIPVGYHLLAWWGSCVR
jgi:phosphatidate cytidylyltransferase